MGKVDHLRNRVEPFAALFWALGNELANTGPCPLARHHSPTVHKECSYMVIIQLVQSMVQFSTKTCWVYVGTVCYLSMLYT